MKNSALQKVRKQSVTINKLQTTVDDPDNESDTSGDEHGDTEDWDHATGLGENEDDTGDDEVPTTEESRNVVWYIIS